MLYDKNKKKLSLQNMIIFQFCIHTIKCPPLKHSSIKKSLQAFFFFNLNQRYLQNRKEEAEKIQILSLFIDSHTVVLWSHVRCISNTTVEGEIHDHTTKIGE
jgi:hypothetical protein